jgi:hypothetical protein
MLKCNPLLFFHHMLPSVLIGVGKMKRLAYLYLSRELSPLKGRCGGALEAHEILHACFFLEEVREAIPGI